MNLSTLLSRLWRLFQPRKSVAARMRKDWDERARTNSRYFVATAKEDWTDAEFFESGRKWLELYVLPDLELICRGRSPADLRMLEIGCGAGRMTKSLAELFGSVDAVDVSPEMIAKARAALAGCSNVRLHLTDGITLSAFKDTDFDFIFSAIVFQHIPRKSIVRGYISEASRVLRPGGVFKFQVEGAPVKERHADTWHGAGFSESEIKEIATDYGFTIHASTGAGTQYFWLTFVKGEGAPQ